MKGWLSVFASTVAAVAVAFHAAPALGQSGGKAAKKSAYKVPRTPQGVPDLQGVWFTRSGIAAWDVEEHPAGLGIPAGPSIVTDPPDKKIPYQPWAIAKRKDLIDNHPYDDPQAHCYVSGPPRVAYAPFGLQIFQGKDYVVFTYENFHMYRFVPTDGRPHINPAFKLFMGDSRGHWEGDTLVIDVTNQNGRTWLDMAANFTTDALHVVERYRRTADDTIEFSATLTDPKLYTRPWTMAFELGPPPTPNYELMEFACWEGERDLVHYPEQQGAPKQK